MRSHFSAYNLQIFVIQIWGQLFPILAGLTLLVCALIFIEYPGAQPSMFTLCIINDNNETMADGWLSFFAFVFKREANLYITPAVYGPIEIAILAVSITVNFFAVYFFLEFRRQSSNAATVRMNLGFAYITSVDLVLHTFWLVVVSLSAASVTIKMRIYLQMLAVLTPKFADTPLGPILFTLSVQMNNFFYMLPGVVVLVFSPAIRKAFFGYCLNWQALMQCVKRPQTKTPQSKVFAPRPAPSQGQMQSPISGRAISAPI